MKNGSFDPLDGSHLDRIEIPKAAQIRFKLLARGARSTVMAKPHVAARSERPGGGDPQGQRLENAETG